MASTFTTSFRLDKQGIGDNKSTWGTIANRNFDLIEAAVVGYIDVPIANVDTNLAGVDGAADTPRNFMLNFTGTLTANRTVTVPRASKTYIIRNSTTGTPSAFSIIFKCLSETLPARQVTLRGGEMRFVYFDTALNAWTNESLVDRSTTTRRWATTPYVDLTGAMEVGKSIEFHNIDADATDFAVRLGSFNASGTASTTDLYITPAGGAASAAGLIWNSNNDGPASGLNADLLDNLHASDIGIPAGTSMLFMQTAAPTGWVKQTTYNDRALRIVSGAVAAGGSVAFSAAFVNQGVNGTVGGTAITTAQMPAHSHTLSGTGTVGNEASHTHGAGTYSATQGATAATGGSHTHTITGQIAQSGAGSAGFGFAAGNGSLPDSTPTANAGGAHSHDVNGTSDAGSNHTHGFSHTFSINNNGSDGTHTHTFTGTAINLAVQYVDAIICTKS